uniref:Uncharacterized protein n=1 Tax=Aegilops tauschii TaxID=37682 RepID=N1QTP8_AEGTA
MVKLPNATYTTEPSGCASSHSKQLASSGQNCPTGFRSSWSANSGPMGIMSGHSSNAPVSASWNDLHMTISARSVT